MWPADVHANDTIPLRRILDPRPVDVASGAPLDDAANIPLAELPYRTHELPDPATGPICVADVGHLARDAVKELVRLGRTTKLVTVTPADRPSP